MIQTHYPFRYGVYRKNTTRPIVRTRTREEADKLVKYNFVECEVKEL